MNSLFKNHWRAVLTVLNLIFTLIVVVVKGPFHPAVISFGAAAAFFLIATVLDYFFRGIKMRREDAARKNGSDASTGV